MGFKNVVKQLTPDFVLQACRGRYRHEDVGAFGFEHDAPDDVKRDILEKYGYDGDLADIFTGSEEYVIHKWHHYIPIYDRYFSHFRGRKVRFLEIGVCKGGSLQMWRRYFGEDAVIFGVDIDPACAKYDGLAGQVRIGSQTDKQFLESVVQEMGGVDVILDDGSHQMRHIPITLRTLFPHLSDNGIYMVEDLHTAYWRSFGGGYRSGRNFFRFVRDVADDIHRWYHVRGMKQEAVGRDCSGIHIHDSIVVFEKNRIHRPVHSKIGRNRL